MISDSDPDLFIPVGFRGGIQDQATGLVHFNTRSTLSSPLNSKIVSGKPPIGDEESSDQFFEGSDYDPRIGQWASPGIAELVNHGATPFYPYQIADPVNLHPLYNHMTKTSSWLEALGFELNNVAPDPQIASRQKVRYRIDFSSSICNSYISAITTRVCLP